MDYSHNHFKYKFKTQNEILFPADLGKQRLCYLREFLSLTKQINYSVTVEKSMKVDYDGLNLETMKNHTLVRNQRLKM